MPVTGVETFVKKIPVSLVNEHLKAACSGQQPEGKLTYNRQCPDDQESSTQHRYIRVQYIFYIAALGFPPYISLRRHVVCLYSVRLRSHFNWRVGRGTSQTSTKETSFPEFSG